MRVHYTSAMIANTLHRVASHASLVPTLQSSSSVLKMTYFLDSEISRSRALGPLSHVQAGATAAKRSSKVSSFFVCVVCLSMMLCGLMPQLAAHTNIHCCGYVRCVSTVVCRSQTPFHRFLKMRIKATSNPSTEKISAGSERTFCVMRS